MTTYILRRLLLIIPTLLAILLVNFAIVQAAPGGRWNRPWRACRVSAAARLVHGSRRCKAGPAPPVAWTPS